MPESHAIFSVDSSWCSVGTLNTLYALRLQVQAYTTVKRLKKHKAQEWTITTTAKVIHSNATIPPLTRYLVS